MAKFKQTASRADRARALAEEDQRTKEIMNRKLDEARRLLDQGVHHAEAGQNFEALASFMKARDFVSAFQKPSPGAWRIHATASADIALVYQMQNLPATALDFMEVSLEIARKHPSTKCNSTFE